jgi:hypothetical protein
MLQAGFKAEIPKGFDFSKVEKSLKRGLTEASHEYRADMESFVMNWVHKPDITQEAKNESDGFYIRIFPTGDNLKYWLWVSFGVSGKRIVPVSAPNLVFKYRGAGVSYAPKTAPGGAFGGAGKKIGPVQRFKAVQWPGIEPRKFEEQAILYNQKQFDKIMSDALAKGLKESAS